MNLTFAIRVFPFFALLACGGKVEVGADHPLPPGSGGATSASTGPSGAGGTTSVAGSSTDVGTGSSSVVGTGSSTGGSGGAGGVSIGSGGSGGTGLPPDSRCRFG